MTMIYRRLPLLSQPSGGFAYVLAFEGANFVQIGLGYESTNGLQVTHVKSCNLHHTTVEDFAKLCEADGANSGLYAGKLAPYFADAEIVTLNPSQMKDIAGFAREVRKLAFGHPLDFEPFFVDLCNGRFVWMMYGSDIDKVRLGIGFIDEFGDRHIGEHSYAIDMRFAAEFAAQAYLGQTTIFYTKPPGWRDRDARVAGLEAKEMAIGFLKLADQAWPGEVKAQ